MRLGVRNANARLKSAQHMMRIVGRLGATGFGDAIAGRSRDTANIARAVDAQNARSIARYSTPITKETLCVEEVSMADWIVCAERQPALLPVPGEPMSETDEVLVWITHEKRCSVASLTDLGEGGDAYWDADNGDSCYELGAVSHWMPLPPSPLS
jgi:hypothetical protein